MKIQKQNSAPAIQVQKFPLLFILIFTCSPFFSLFSQSVETADSEVASINLSQLQVQIATAPLVNGKSNAAPVVVDIPMPGYCSEPFEIWESTLMDPEMAEAFPSIKTYVITSLSSPTAHGRLTVSHLGMHANIHSPQGAVDIIPVQNSNNNSDHKINIVSPEEVFLAKECGMAAEISTKNWEDHLERQEAMAAQKSFPFDSGDILRTYNFGTIVTGEFYQANKDDSNGSANDDADVVAVLTAIVNSVEAYYDRDLAVRFNLLTPVLYDDPVTDPFQPDEEPGASSRTTQAAEQMFISFPVASYDLGHVFHNTAGTVNWSGGGVAGLGVVCNNGGPADAPWKGISYT